MYLNSWNKIKDSESTSKIMLGHSQGRETVVKFTLAQVISYAPVHDYYIQT